MALNVDNLSCALEKNDLEAVTANHISLAFARPPVFECILSYCSPQTIFRLARTCRLVHSAVQEFSQRAWNINKHFLRFFADVRGFRSLQGRTGTLVSGSDALQFLDRTFYPSSDLDLYVNRVHSRQVGTWLVEQEGYKFVPNPRQTARGLDNWLAAGPVDAATEDQHIADAIEFHSHQYRLWGVSNVFTFLKEERDGDPEKVQIIECRHTPLECILDFHSTCVMNIIAFDAAYCLYPWATFEDRNTLTIGELCCYRLPPLTKYKERGWRVTTNFEPDEEQTQKTPFFLDEARWVDDQHSWTLKLDMGGIEERPRLGWDPVVQHSWELKLYNDSGSAWVDYSFVHTTVMRPGSGSSLLVELE